MKRLRKVACSLLAITCLQAVIAASAFALTPSEVFEKVKDSVVVIKALDSKGEPTGLGSGVMLPSGKIATNCHVLKIGERFQIGRGGKSVAATLHAQDSDKDLCLLEASGLEASPVQLGKAATLKVGEAVYAIGSPQGLELSISDGIVSQLRGAAPPIIQTTAAISPGSSGGGLFDAEGRLVGITTFHLESGQSLNFAVPVEWLDEIKPGKTQTAKGRSQADWLAKEVTLQERKDWHGLLNWCRQWSRADPDNFLAWFCLGVAYGKLNQNIDAIEAYRAALRIGDNAEAWYNLGLVYGEINRPTDEIKAYREAVRIKPDFTDAWNALGVTYDDLNRPNDAIEAFRMALRIKPDDANAWSNLGVAYINLNRHTDAVEAFRAALRIKPDYANAWTNLGVAYNNLSRHTDAIEAYRAALRIRPDGAHTWLSLGVTYRNLNRYTDAIEAFRAALRIEPDNAEAWFHLAASYSSSGNRGAALEAVEELRRYDPKRADRLFAVIVPK
jgi:tetratricopeptide (TPR) repeat protein